MRLRGIVGCRHDGREGEAIGAVREQVAEQDGLDLGFRHAHLDLTERCLKG